MVFMAVAIVAQDDARIVAKVEGVVFPLYLGWLGLKEPRDA
jgi:hypothetical protein